MKHNSMGLDSAVVFQISIKKFLGAKLHGVGEVSMISVRHVLNSQKFLGAKLHGVGGDEFIT